MVMSLYCIANMTTTDLAGDEGDGSGRDGADEQGIRHSGPQLTRHQPLPVGAAPRVGLLVSRLP